METHFSKTFLKIVHEFSHPAHFQKKPNPFFIFILVVEGVTFSDYFLPFDKTYTSQTLHKYL